MKKFLVSLIFLLSACGGLASLDEATVSPPTSSEAPSTAPPSPLPVVEDAIPTVADASSVGDASDAGVADVSVPPTPCGPNIMATCRGTSQGVPYCRMVSGPQDAGPLCSLPNESFSDTTCEETFSYCQWRSGSACYLVTNLTEAECAARGGHL